MRTRPGTIWPRTFAKLFDCPTLEESDPMSAIASIGGSGIAQFIQKLRKQQTTKAASGTSTVNGSGSPGGISGPGQLHGSGSALFSQIQQTVTNALQQAKASGSTKDPNQIVEDSIASLLKNIFSGKTPAPTGSAQSSPQSQLAFQTALKSAGITPQQFQTDFKSAVEDAQDSLASPIEKGSTLDVTG